MKDIIIIGAGIAGLSAGIYARRSGFNVTIVEGHSIPGGNSTSWKRNGYFFEGGMHWLTGSSDKTSFHKLWIETGAITESTPIYYRDPFLTYLDGDQEICLYRNVDKLREHLTKISPADKKAIDTLCDDIEKFTLMNMPISDVKGTKLKYKTKSSKTAFLKMMPAFSRMGALSKINVGEYLENFTHKGIKNILSQVVGLKTYSAMSILFTLACLATKDGGYPKGGSLTMASNMAKKFISLGGEIRYNTKVSKIVLKDNKADYIIANGEKMTASSIVVTVDALSAIDNLFEKPLVESWTEKMRKNTTPVLCTFVGLGIEKSIKNLPENLIFPTDTPLKIGDESYELIGVNNYATFEGYAPNNCTSATMVLIGDTYDYWNEAKKQGKYLKKKEELAKSIVDVLENKFSELKGAIKVLDVATPLTYERYCGTYKGSWMTVMKENETPSSYPLKSESVSNLYFAGQRMSSPGGLPVAASTGRNAIQHICKDNDVIFENNC